MIRPFTCVSMLLACASGLYLYQTKHRAQLLDREIAHTLQLAEAARARTGVLRAEWALLNEPGRLSELADRYLALKTMAPTQFVSLDQLGQRLPAPGHLPFASPEPDAAPEAPAAETPKLLSEAPPPEPDKPEPAKQASALPPIIPNAEAAPVPPEAVIAAPPQKHPERRETSGTAYASTSDANSGFVGDAPRAPILQQSLPPPPPSPQSPQSLPASSAQTLTPPAAPPPRPNQAPAAPKRQVAAIARPAAPKITPVTYPQRLVAPAALPAKAAVGGSLLGGMRAALPPPVPFDHGQAPP